MNQRKMFDDELDGMMLEHSQVVEKLKKMHSEDKHKLEQLLNQHKENTDNVGGTGKDAPRCLEKCRNDTTSTSTSDKVEVGRGY